MIINQLPGTEQASHSCVPYQINPNGRPNASPASIVTKESKEITLSLLDVSITRLVSKKERMSLMFELGVPVVNRTLNLGGCS